ncbi:MAG: histidine ammonia-lyase [Tistlia sp.]|uniref:histidine ammonia-lyase n=1 Tax=Tistlia sp. TaxID=3057121 RepID=UPI0034A1CE94
MSSVLDLVPDRLDLAALRAFWRAPGAIALSEAARRRIGAAQGVLEGAVRASEAPGAASIYGITTGFGENAKYAIAPDARRALQRKLVVSHATGTGPDLPDAVVRLALLLKAHGLSRGFSGVRPEVVETLIALAGGDALPVVPAWGSMGASGDLAPLAHIGLVVLGEPGGRFRHAGAVHPAERLEAVTGIAPLADLAPKEGLALINGTEVATALGLVALFEAENALAAALVAGALTLDAAFGNPDAFSALINERARRQHGQAEVARLLRGLLEGSGRTPVALRVQDPYSLRCQPQVVGAALDTLRFAATLLEREAGSTTDNPVLDPEADPEDPDSRPLISGGNFHAEPVAFAADAMALAVSEIASMAERRVAFLIDSSKSGFPPFLAAGIPGLDSGLMNAQVTAAALVCQLRVRAAPASVQSLPTSADQEDHVSMGTFGAWRLLEMVDCLRRVVAVELLAALQASYFAPRGLPEGLDGRALVLAGPLAEAKAAILARLPAPASESAFIGEDRVLAGVIDTLAEMIAEGAFRRFAPVELG